jgi:hypothetical protein
MQNYVHNFSHFSKFLQNEISNAMYISSHKKLVLKLIQLSISALSGKELEHVFSFYLSRQYNVGEPTSCRLISPGLKGLIKTITMISRVGAPPKFKPAPATNQCEAICP